MGLIISVSGLRGVVGVDLTVFDALKAGMLFANALGDDTKGPVVLAGDSRPSGGAIRAAVAAGLMGAGKDIIDLGIVTTPGAALMVRQLKAEGGCIVTASHNPFEWNGIKFIGPDGLAFDKKRAELIKERFSGPLPMHKTADLCGGMKRLDTTHERHVQAVLDSMDKNLLKKIRQKRYKVVLDSINGAGCEGTAILLKRLGCELIHMNNEPTGFFAHRPEPTEENLVTLVSAVKKYKADIGFAQDPDGDRLAVVDDTGRYIGEEYTLVLASWFVLKRRPGPIAVNLSTSRMIEDLAARFGQKVIRTPVGEANVARAVIEYNCPIGGEGNGGVIYPDVVPVRDSFSAIALILQLMAETDSKVSELVKGLPSYVMIKKKFPAESQKVGRIISLLIEKYRQHKIDITDGVRIDFPERKAWVHIRPSNTEPIVRIIAEAKSRDDAEALIGMITEDIGIRLI